MWLTDLRAGLLFVVDPLTGILLAGGGSRRFGSDKASAPLNGRPMLEWVARAVGEACEAVIVVKATGQVLPETAVPVTVIEDFVADRGPLAGLLAGLRVTDGPLAFATSCDAPLLRPALICLLADLAPGYDVVCPEIDGRLQPLVAVYRVSTCKPVFERALAAGITRLIDAFEGLKLRRADAAALRAADARLESFVNVNRPDDLAAMERRFAEGFQP